MAAPKGNRFWEARSRHGRKPKFESGQMLKEACVDYFEWNADNPLYEAKLVSYQGESTIEYMPKMRAMTLQGLTLFLGVSMEAWHQFRQRQDLIAVTKWAEQIIYDQKFTGASADLLNANIIARDLGLRDKTETTHKGSVGLTDMSEDELNRKLQQLEQEHDQSERD